MCVKDDRFIRNIHVHVLYLTGRNRGVYSNNEIQKSTKHNDNVLNSTNVNTNNAISFIDRRDQPTPIWSGFCSGFDPLSHILLLPCRTLPGC